MANHLHDLSGARLGRITVLRRGASRNGRTYWICICSCSPKHEVEIRTDVLTRTRGIRNCGCWKREKASVASRKPDDAIGYGAAHDRVRRARGHPYEYPCVSCDRAAAHWALKDEAKAGQVGTEGAHAGLPYSPNPEDYQPMCRSCHSSYDLNTPWGPLPRVVRGLQQRIVSGQSDAGSPLPSVVDLAANYGVGRSTVYRALGLLASRGLHEMRGHRYLVAGPDRWWRF